MFRIFSFYVRGQSYEYASLAEAFLRILDPDDPEGDILFMSSNAGAGISDAPGMSSEIGWTGNRVLALAGRGNLYVRSKKEVQEVIIHVWGRMPRVALVYRPLRCAYTITVCCCKGILQ